MIVVDASAVLELLFGTPKGLRLEQRLFAQGETLHAPDLLDLEVVQVIRRHLRSNLISRVRAQEAFDDFLALKLKRYSHDVLLRRIWSLRDKLAAYDAAYVALAEMIGAPLVTTDSRIALAPGHAAIIEKV